MSRDQHWFQRMTLYVVYVPGRQPTKAVCSWNHRRDVSTTAVTTRWLRAVVYRRIWITRKRIGTVYKCRKKPKRHTVEARRRVIFPGDPGRRRRQQHQHANHRVTTQRYKKWRCVFDVTPVGCRSLLAAVVNRYWNKYKYDQTVENTLTGSRLRECTVASAK